MKLGTVLKISARALRRNVSRSALTILGIVIGIAAVIAMMEIGQGSSSAIADTIATMGANNLLILPGAAASGGISFGAGSTLTLTAQDCAAILRECDAIATGAPIVRLRAPAIYGDRNWVPGTIYGTTAEYLDVRQWSDLAEGECFGDADVRNASRVCLVGQTIVRELFEGASPLGRELRLQNVAFRVIGVLAPKGANAFGTDQDDTILAPWTTLKYRLSGSSAGAATSSFAPASNGGNALYPGGPPIFPAPSAAQLADLPMPVRFANVDQVIVAARSAEAMPEAMRQVTELLRERHHLGAAEASDFNLRDMTESAHALAQTTTVMTNLLLTVALISLVVGGVGIMNIMLVSVRERTREIGLRMAVGARARDVLAQFLLEAVLLCSIGGVLGLALGRGSSAMVAELLSWPIQPSLLAAFVSIAVSAAVGIVFGFYPAWKAARLDPIEALRYE
jgi:ABC-type antimicrobial peptide transport system permease subunit